MSWKWWGLDTFSRSERAASAIYVNIHGFVAPVDEEHADTRQAT